METEDVPTPIRWRPERYEAVRPNEDFKGKPQLHPFNPLTFARHGVQVGMPLDQIPGDYWALDTDDEGFSVAEVACPCGESPRVDAGGLLTCKCERCYIFTSSEVYVLNSQKGRQPDQTPEASASA